MLSWNLVRFAIAFIQMFYVFITSYLTFCSVCNYNTETKAEASGGVTAAVNLGDKGN